jgi:hypothetical protein
MNQGGGGPWKGKSEQPGASLQKAIEAAWEKASGDGAPAGKYVVQKIEIEASNPITAYVVVIGPG